MISTRRSWRSAGASATRQSRSSRTEAVLGQEVGQLARRQARHPLAAGREQPRALRVEVAVQPGDERERLVGQHAIVPGGEDLDPLHVRASYALSLLPGSPTRTSTCCSSSPLGAGTERRIRSPSTGCRCFRAGGVRLQICPIYVEGNLVPDGALRSALRLAGAFHEAVRANPDGAFQVASADGLDEAEAGERVGLRARPRGDRRRSVPVRS